MNYGYTPVDEVRVTIQVSIGDIKDLIKIVDSAHVTVRAHNTGDSPSWKWKTQRFREQLRQILQRAGNSLEYESTELKNQKLSQEDESNA